MKVGFVVVVLLLLLLDELLFPVLLFSPEEVFPLPELPPDDFAFTVTEIVLLPVTVFSLVSPTSEAVTVIVAVPLLTAVIVTLLLSLIHSEEVLTFAILELEELILNFPSQFDTLMLNVVVSPSVNVTLDFETEKLP